MVYVADHVDHIYCDYTTEQHSQKQHKEEMKHRRLLDASLIEAEVDKYPHPLEDNRPILYNPVTGQIAPADVNVANSSMIGENMESNYIASLPDGFFNAISSPIKTKCKDKEQVASNKSKPVIDLENIFLQLLMIGQRRQLELEPLFAYELCAVPSALIDEQSCLRKGNKSVLVKRLGVVELSAKPADTIIINVSQLFYHIVWPHGGSPSNMIASIQTQLSRYPCDSKKVVAFDKYRDVSTKDHERMRRAGEAIADYELSITSTLP